MVERIVKVKYNEEDEKLDLCTQYIMKIFSLMVGWKLWKAGTGKC